MYESLRSDFLWYWNDYLLRIPDYLFQMQVCVIRFRCSHPFVMERMIDWCWTWTDTKTVMSLTCPRGIRGIPVAFVPVASATLKYRLEDEMIADWVSKVKREESLCEKSDKNSIQNLPNNINEMSDQELAVWYNDHVIYPDKVRLNCYYYRHYSFIKDIQMILCTVLGKKMEYAGEVI